MTDVLDGGPEDRGSLQNRFGYHKPTNQDIIDAHQKIRHDCQWLALSVLDLVPQSREQSLALTKIEEAMYWANAGIARIRNYQE